MDAAASYRSRTESCSKALAIRSALPDDADALWAVIEPIIRVGETYPLPRDMSKAAALGYWCSAAHEVFVAERERVTVGTYYVRRNHQGGGKHVANCGYIVAPHARGCGVGRAMCTHSIAHARARGFRAMQFNFVVASNEGAVRLWQSCGFAIVGRLREAFEHPSLGFVDALVMHRAL
jgi:ribosomal protein S18 acetylase RimI-like enzyme